jgi:hypothetical protein
MDDSDSPVFTGICEAFAMRTPPILCISMYLTQGEFLPLPALGSPRRPLYPCTLETYMTNDSAPTTDSTIPRQTPRRMPIASDCEPPRGRRQDEDTWPYPSMSSASCGVPRAIRAIRCALVWYRRGERQGTAGQSAPESDGPDTLNGGQNV